MLTPERMAKTAGHGEDGRRHYDARRRRPEAERTAMIRATGGLPARTDGGGGRGARGGDDGVDHLLRGGRGGGRGSGGLGLGFPRGERAGGE